MTGTLLRAVAFIVIGVGGAAFFYYIGNLICDRVLPQEAGDAVRPYIFILPALFVVSVFLIYPLIDTVRQTLYGDRFVDGERPFVGLDNYVTALSGGGVPIFAYLLLLAVAAIAVVIGVTRRMAPGDPRRQRARRGLFAGLAVLFVGAYAYDVVTDDLTGNSAVWAAIWNNILWIAVVPAGAVAIGLLVAVLADRLPSRFEAAAKSMIFMPMAISFVGASVVWGLVYDISTTGEQIGLLNAIVTGLFGIEPVPWLEVQAINDFALMVIMIWLQSGFAMVLLSAAIKSVPEDTIEAARIDGATEVQIFWRVVVPQIQSTIVVVLTTILILVLKVFDVVQVLTNGRNDTQVIANLFYQEFSLGNYGSAGVIVVVLVLACIPFMVINVKRFREQEATR